MSAALEKLKADVDDALATAHDRVIDPLREARSAQSLVDFRSHVDEALGWSKALTTELQALRRRSR